MEQLKTYNLFDLKQTIADDLLKGAEYPWEVLSLIKDYIIKLGEGLPSCHYIKHSHNIWISKTAQVAQSANLNGPLIIDDDAEVRHCAYIRGSVIVGKGAIVGNSTELKNVILFNNVQVPHYNYVGDSILGKYAHMGAGSITSNIKSDKTLVTINTGHSKIETNLLKVGAIIGDYVEIGCNTVLNPGTIIGRNSTIYPLLMVRGIINENSIYKKQGEIVTKN